MFSSGTGLGTASDHSPASNALPAAGEWAEHDVRDVLLRITREMVGATESQALLQTMVEAALQIIPSAEKCVIHLLDASGERLYPRVCSQPTDDLDHQAGISANMGIAGKALQERRTLCVGDVTTSPDFVPLRSGNDLRSLLVAPLCVGATPLGTLNLSSGLAHAFGPQDAQIAGTLAAQASVAIHQAELFQNAVVERQVSDAIIESLPDGLLILDGQGRLARMNPALHALIQTSSASIPMPCTLDDLQRISPSLVQIIDPSGGMIIGPYESQLDLPSGSGLTVLVTPATMQAPAQGQVRIVHNVTTERAAARSLALFISQISHELRTPLQHIMSFASLLGELDLPQEKQHRFFEHIQDEAGYMGRLVDDLVQLSRIQTGRFSIYLERTRIDTLVRETVTKLTPRSSLKGLNLSLQDAQEAVWALTDPMRLEQVLANLLENAFKYVPAGGNVRVTIETTTRDLTLRVADDGPGIKEDQLAHIFEQYYQAGEQTGRPRGMGLGLYISDQVMRALGGRIWAESTVGEGSVFSIGMPRIVG